MPRESQTISLVANQLEDLVANCVTCRQAQVQRADPSAFPELPWQKVGMDLFEWKKMSYLLIVDYYSRYIEIAKLTKLTAEEVIRHTKSIFARHGIPEVIVSDNGPQFSAETFTKFAQDYQFKHTTSSPYYPRSNGGAERAVGTVKNLLEKESDPYLALLAYRVTPLSNGYSPSELLMSRRLRSTVPTTRESRRPAIPDRWSLIKKEEEAKRKQKDDYDRRHGVRELPALLPGDTVWMSDRKEKANVGEEVAPRSYEVETSSGSYRRNRKDLISLPRSTSPNEDPTSSTTNPTQPLRRSSRTTSKPDRWDPSHK